MPSATAPPANEIVARRKKRRDALKAHKVWPLRRDLQINRQRYEDRFYAVIKDPISLQYFRLPWTDYELAKYIEAHGTIGELIAAWKTIPELEKAPEEALLKKAVRLTRNLEGKKLCELSGKRFLEKRTIRLKQRARARRFSWMTRWLIVRKSLFDPDRLLAWITPKVAFLFTTWFSLAAFALMVAGTVVVYSNRTEIQFDPGWFFSFDNLALFYLSFVCLKIIHELGHGIACKHFGGEVHEVGVMLMALTPLFYVNVTDTWLFPNKKHRMAVSSAGVYVELIFAALLAFVWVLLAPGFWKQFAFNAMLIASLTTLLFNANPLMRFDGYYVLSDWLEIPNLRQKSRTYISEQFHKLFFGADFSVGHKTFPFPRKDTRIFAAYAVLSFTYLILLMWRVLQVMDNLMDKVGLRFAGHILVLMWVFAALILPITMFFKRPFRNAPALPLRKRLRPVMVTVALILLVLLILQIPWRKNVVRSCAFELANADLIRAAQPGFVREVLVHEGDLVRKDQVLARLQNPELEVLAKTQEQSLQEMQTLLSRAINENNAQQYQVFTHERNGLQADVQETESKLADLELKATRPGRIITRQLQDKKGHYVETGATFCVVAPESDFSILIPLSEREARFVKKGADVVLKVNGMPERTFRGAIVQEPLSVLGSQLPAALSAQRGGDVATTMDAATGKEKILEKQWYAELRIVETDNLLRLGMTGRVRIDCGMKTIGKIFGQNVLDFVNLDYRL